MKGFQKLLGVIIFLVVGLLIGWSIPRSPLIVTTEVAGVTTPVAREISVMFDEGDGTVTSFSHEAFEVGESLFDVTKRIAAREGMTFVHEPPGEFGILVTGISDKAGGTDGKFWLYWVDNEIGQVAADQYTLLPGDIVEWKFINLKF